MRISAIQCRTNTGEMAEIPVAELLQVISASGAPLGNGVVPKSNGSKYVASGISVDAAGQIRFNGYGSDKAFIGMATGIIGFTNDGRLITLPLQQQQSQTGISSPTQEAVSTSSTENMLPYFSDSAGSLASTTILNDNGNYSVGGQSAFWKWSVEAGSINIDQGGTGLAAIKDGYRINGKLVLSFDPVLGELTIGNTVYKTTNIQYLKSHSVAFNTEPDGVVMGPGVMSWNDTYGTVEIGLKGGNLIYKLGQSSMVYVKHADNSGLAKGTVVYPVGSDGSNKTVRLARANAELTSSKTFGVIAETVTGGGKAFCITEGLIEGIDTLSLTEGSAVYLSPSVAGGFTTTKPVAPNHMVLVGFCIKSHAVNGSIFVKVQNGFELDELHDVLIGTLANNNLLAYESATSLWKNKTYTELGLAAGVGTLNYVPKWSNATGGLVNSLIIENGTNVGVSMATPTSKVHSYSTAAYVQTQGISSESDSNRITLGAGSSGSAIFDTNYMGVDESGLLSSKNMRFSIYGASGSYYKWSNNGVEQMRIASTGNVGIGTATPSVRLHVLGSGVNSNVAIFSGANSTRGLMISTAAVLDNDDFVMLNAQHTSGLFGFFTNNAERMRIASNGNVGIGTATPSGRLSLSLPAGAFGTTNPYTNFFYGSNQVYRSYMDGNWNVVSEVIQNSTNQSGLVYFTNNAERMRIASNGNVGVATISPIFKLDVNGGAEFGLAYVGRPDNTLTNTINFGYGADNDTQDGWINYVGFNGSTTRFRNFHIGNGKNTAILSSIGTTGNIGIGVTNPGYRLDVSGGARFSNDVVIGSAAVGINSFLVAKNITGGVDASGIRSSGQIQSDVTSNAFMFRAVVNQANFELPNLIVYESTIGTISGTGTSLVNFRANVNPTGFTNVFGFQGTIATGTNRWNLYMNGSAPNYMAGRTFIGSTTENGTKVLQVNGGIRQTDVLSNIVFANNQGEFQAATAANVNTLLGNNNLTTNFVTKWNGTAFANSQIFDNGTNVGIGYASPQSKLYVDMPNGTAGVIFRSLGATNNPGLYFTVNESTTVSAIDASGSTSGILALSTSGVEKMRILSNGNVGIGITSPATRLNTNGTIRISATDPIRYEFDKTGAYFSWIETDGIAGNNFMRFGVANGEAVRIIQNGNVGIGTSNPTEKLEVVGTVLARGGLGVRSFRDGSESISSQLYIANALNNRAFNFQMSSDNERMHLFAFNGTTWNNRATFHNDGNVGIGTATPADRLTVEGGNIGVRSGNFVRLYHSGNNNWSTINSPASGAFAINTGGLNNAFYITTGGNVGIGTASPSATLHVVRNGSETLRLQRSSGTNFRIATFLDAVGTQMYSTTSADNAFNPIRIDGSYIALNTDTGGNVGIGTTSPTQLLHVNGNTRLGERVEMQPSRRIGAGLDFGNAGEAGSGYLEFYNTATGNTSLVNTTNFASITLHTNNIERFRILANGNVGIGTSTPQRRLHIRGTEVGISTYQQILESPTSGYGAGLSFQSPIGGSGVLTEMARITADGENTWNETLALQSAGLRFFTMNQGSFSEKVRILANGNLGVGTTSPIQSIHLRKESAVAVSASSITASTLAGTLISNLDISANIGASIAFQLGGTGTAWASIAATRPSANNSHLSFYTELDDVFSEKVRILNNGNVGIGTITPTERLHVVGSILQTGFNTGLAYADASGRLVKADNATILSSIGGNYIQNQFTAGQVGNFWITGQARIDGSNGIKRGLEIYANGTTLDWEVVSTANTRQFSIGEVAGANRLIIERAGNVGIGTSSALALLHLGGATNKGVRINSATNNAAFLAGWQDQAIISVNRDGWSGNFVDATKAAASIQLEGLTTGSNIQFYTTSSVNVLQTERMRIAANGFVGIGTASPSANLHINNSAGNSDFRMTSAGGAVLRLLNSQSETSIGNMSNHDLWVNTDSTVRMIIKAGGNVGIGTTNPDSRLQVDVANIANTNLVKFSTNGGVNNYGDISVQSAELRYRSPFAIGIAPNNTVSAFFASTGNVGIGTTNPTDKLHVNSVLAFNRVLITNTGDFQNGIRLFRTGGTVPTDWEIYTPNNSTNLNFFNGGNRVTITPAGNVGIGITNPSLAIIVSNDATKAQLLLQGFATHAVLQSTANGEMNIGSTPAFQGRVGYDGQNNANLRFTNTFVASTQTQGGFDFINGSGNNVLRINPNGNVGIGTTNPLDRLSLIDNSSIGLNASVPADISRLNWRYQGSVISWIERVNSDGAMVFGVQSAERVRIASNGNVGIGTTTPNDRLDVVGTGHFTGAVLFDAVPSTPILPTLGSHIANKAYVDSLSFIKRGEVVRTLSNTNITLSGTQTINGVAVAAGNLVLVAGQTTASQNGVYVVASGAWTRSTLADTDLEIRGAYHFISEGTFANQKYINTNTSVITVGTTAITYGIDFGAEVDPIFISWRDTSRSANQVFASGTGSGAGVGTWRALVPADIPTLNQNTTGSAAILTTARTISATGDGTWSVSFNGSADVSGALILANVATAGTYRSVTVNAKGLVTAGTNPTTLAGYGITDAYTKTESDARYQGLDADLTAIGALTGTSGVLIKSGGAWTLDSTSYITANNLISFIATTSQLGFVAIGTTMEINGFGVVNQKSGIVTTGTYRSVTVDTYGRVTAGTNPTTLLGYGITDAYTKTESDARFVALAGSYANPTWITSLAWSKLSGVPTTFAPSAHTHAAGDIVSGVIATARLGSGTASETTFLRGDQTWATLPAPTLTSTRIGFGSGSNLLTSSANFAFEDDRVISIKNGVSSKMELARFINSNNYGVYVTGGNLDLQVLSGGIITSKSNHNFEGRILLNNAAGNAGQVLTSQGAGSSPIWTTVAAGGVQNIDAVLGAGNTAVNKNLILNGTNGVYDSAALRFQKNGATLASIFFDNQYVSRLIIESSQKIQINANTNSVELYGSSTILGSLAGTGTRMVVADASGVLSTQAIPSGGGGGTPLNLTQTASITNGVFFSWLVNQEGDYRISTPGKQNLAGIGIVDNNSKMVQVAGFENSPLQILGGNSIHLKNFTSLNSFIDLDTNEVRMSGSRFRLSYSDFFGGSFSPSMGDKFILTYNSGTNAFVMQKIQVYTNPSDSRNYLIL